MQSHLLQQAKIPQVCASVSKLHLINLFHSHVVHHLLDSYSMGASADMLHKMYQQLRNYYILLP